MKDLLLCVHVVVKTLNLEISRFYRFGRLRQRIVLKSVLHVLHDYFSSFNQSDHCFVASLLLLPSSLLKLPNVLITAELPGFSPRYQFDNSDFQMESSARFPEIDASDLLEKRENKLNKNTQIPQRSRKTWIKVFDLWRG